MSAKFRTARRKSASEDTAASVTSPVNLFVTAMMDGRPLQLLPFVYKGNNSSKSVSLKLQSFPISWISLNPDVPEDSKFKESGKNQNCDNSEYEKHTSVSQNGCDVMYRCAEVTSTKSHEHRCEKYRKSVRSYLDPKIIIFMVLFLAHGIRCLDNNILQLNIPTEEPLLDPNTVCKTFPDLSPKQYRLCAKYPDVTASAIQGVQIAIHECQNQLQSQRWNCSSLEKKNKNPHSSPLLKKGFRETAFAYAISSAGVTYQVAKACSMGKLKSCGCDLSMQGEVRDKFQWGGCSHNVDFGVKFAKRFTTARETARDVHSRINLHNNRAGRLTILKNVRKQCKCHGMSGSCEIKTCWKISPDFKIVGKLLKEKYHDPLLVNFTNKVDGRSKRRLVRKQDKMKLVYYEKSPNFCDANNKMDSLGTTGRYCDKKTNCDTLCCGRGYNTIKVRRSERCNCKFHWCCYVVCQTCTFNQWVTVCK